jgi:hypothetical protein
MMYRPQFFSLNELVCPEVYNKFGDMAWQFFDDKAVITLDWVRRTLNKPITVNNWNDGGEYTQRGLRCSTCQLVRDAAIANKVYVSPHMLGKGFDFDVEGMSAEEVRVWLAINKDKIPYPIRLENNVNWVHMDCEDTGKKVFLFNP